MMTVFIRERSFCTPQSLAETLGEDESFARLCIEVLTTRGVLKLKSGNELSEYDTDAGPKHRRNLSVRLCRSCAF